MRYSHWNEWGRGVCIAAHVSVNSYAGQQESGVIGVQKVSDTAGTIQIQFGDIVWEAAIGKG